MDLIVKSLQNPWIRLWLVSSIGLAIYWTVTEFSPLVRRYYFIPHEPAYGFVENYVRSPIELYFKDDEGVYSEIGTDIVMFRNRLHCSIPEDAIVCMQKERPPLITLEHHTAPGEFLGSKRGIVTSVAVRQSIEESCSLVMWFGGIGYWSKSDDVKLCVARVASDILARQQKDISKAQNNVVGEFMTQVAYLIGVIAAVGVTLFALSWVIQGFRNAR